MATERKPYAMAFVDGQNLFRHAKSAFGHYHPNYDLIKLHGAVCEQNGWVSNQIRFYTGVPSAEESPMWSGYWANRLLAMTRAGIVCTKRQLRYQRETVFDANGDETEISVAHEKGIDVRLALDVVKMARTKSFDVGVIYSQDQDLREVALEVKEIAKQQDRAILLASAFPFGGNASAKRGIDQTQWIRLDQATYDACLDPYDYRPAPPQGLFDAKRA